LEAALNLAELVTHETKALPKEIILLRHVNKEIDLLPNYHVTIEEFTAI
jgi:hypothetical protein